MHAPPTQVTPWGPFWKEFSAEGFPGFPTLLPGRELLESCGAAGAKGFGTLLPSKRGCGTLKKVIFESCLFPRETSVWISVVENLGKSTPSCPYLEPQL